MENKPLQRIKAVLEVALKITKDKPDEETFYIRTWPNLPLLKDHEGLLIAFEKIDKETNHTVTIKFHAGNPIRGVADYNNHYPTPSQYVLHVENYNELQRYFKEVEKQLNTVQPQFVLKIFSTQKKAEFYLQSNPEIKHPLRTSALRFKLLFFLAKKGIPVKTSEIALELEALPDEIKDTVDDLRYIVDKKFKTDRKYLFENDSNARTGYKLENVMVIES